VLIPREGGNRSGPRGGRHGFVLKGTSRPTHATQSLGELDFEFYFIEYVSK
jgi:hypothetical protein